MTTLDVEGARDDGWACYARCHVLHVERAADRLDDVPDAALETYADRLDIAALRILDLSRRAREATGRRGWRSRLVTRALAAARAVLALPHRGIGR